MDFLNNRVLDANLNSLSTNMSVGEEREPQVPSLFAIKSTKMI